LVKDRAEIILRSNGGDCSINFSGFDSCQGLLDFGTSTYVNNSLMAMAISCESTSSSRGLPPRLWSRACGVVGLATPGLVEQIRSSITAQIWVKAFPGLQIGATVSTHICTNRFSSRIVRASRATFGSDKLNKGEGKLNGS
jgi:hypothetical protein